MGSKHSKYGRLAAAALLLALPALADTRFQVRRMTRDDVPPGKGQCDIRLQVDNQVEVSLHGDMVSARTLAGKDARDDGSECNAPLPRDIQGFHFEIKDSRNEIHLVAEPSKRNDWTAVVAIHDTDSGEGRYHFRLSWNLSASSGHTSSRADEEFERRPPGTFSWNNTLSFKGKGVGNAQISGTGDLRLREVNIDVDRGGKVFASFRVEKGHPLTLTGQVMQQENGRWKADIMSEDHRLRGPMYFTVDERRQVNNVTIDATDGRDRMRLNWDRK